MNFVYTYFKKDEHMPLLDRLMEKRGMPKGDPSFLPPTGFIVYCVENPEPVCIGFQIRCDNRTAINTDIVSDVDAPKHKRNAGVEFLRDILNRSAESAGYQFVVAFTKHEKHAERLSKLGYTVIDSKLFQMGRFLWL